MNEIEVSTIDGEAKGLADTAKECGVSKDFAVAIKYCNWVLTLHATKAHDSSYSVMAWHTRNGLAFPNLWDALMYVDGQLEDQFEKSARAIRNR